MLKFSLAHKWKFLFLTLSALTLTSTTVTASESDPEFINSCHYIASGEDSGITQYQKLVLALADKNENTFKYYDWYNRHRRNRIHPVYGKSLVWFEGTAHDSLWGVTMDTNTVNGGQHLTLKIYQSGLSQNRLSSESKRLVADTLESVYQDMDYMLNSSLYFPGKQRQVDVTQLLQNRSYNINELKISNSVRVVEISFDPIVVDRTVRGVVRSYDLTADFLLSFLSYFYEGISETVTTEMKQFIEKHKEAEVDPEDFLKDMMSKLAASGALQDDINQWSQLREELQRRRAQRASQSNENLQFNSGDSAEEIIDPDSSGFEELRRLMYPDNS